MTSDELPVDESGETRTCGDCDSKYSAELTRCPDCTVASSKKTKQALDSAEAEHHSKIKELWWAEELKSREFEAARHKTKSAVADYGAWARAAYPSVYRVTGSSRFISQQDHDLSDRYFRERSTADNYIASLTDRFDLKIELLDSSWLTDADIIHHFKDHPVPK